MAKKKNATRRILFIVLALVILLAILGAIGKATGLLGERDKSIAVETMPVEIRDQLVVEPFTPAQKRPGRIRLGSAGVTHCQHGCF